MKIYVVIYQEGALGDWDPPVVECAFTKQEDAQFHCEEKEKEHKRDIEAGKCSHKFRRTWTWQEIYLYKEKI